MQRRAERVDAAAPSTGTSGGRSELVRVAAGYEHRPRRTRSPRGLKKERQKLR